jgi:hypothetical protein
MLPLLPLLLLHLRLLLPSGLLGGSGSTATAEAPLLAGRLSSSCCPALHGCEKGEKGGKRIQCRSEQAHQGTFTPAAHERSCQASLCSTYLASSGCRLGRCIETSASSLAALGCPASPCCRCLDCDLRAGSSLQAAVKRCDRVPLSCCLAGCSRLAPMPAPRLTRRCHCRRCCSRASHHSCCFCSGVSSCLRCC